MGAKLDGFLRVLAAGLSPQAYQAQTAETAAQTADVRGQEAEQRAAGRQTEQQNLKIITGGIAAKMAILKDMGIDDPRAKPIVASMKGAIDSAPEQYQKALRGSVGDELALIGGIKPKKAPKVINVKEGKQTVAKQWNPKTGKYEEIARGETGGGTTVNVDTSGSFSKELGKQLGRNFVEKRDNAITASESLTSANKAVELLDSGIISGTGANFITGAAKALHQAGLIESPTIANTEAYAANQAKQVAQIIKAFGAGTGLSDADREYAEKAAAAKITMTEESLRKIIDINARASTNVLNRYNKDAAQIMEKNKDLPFDLMVPIPEFSAAEKKKTLTDDEYEAKKKALGL